MLRLTFATARDVRRRSASSSTPPTRPSIINALVPQFEKETGIKIDLVKAGSGDIIKRVKAEASSPKADVIWSIGGETLEDNKDLLATYKPKDDAVINQAYTVSPEWIPYTGILRCSP